ncbi:unnamed protein product, partial [Amoebophrya sp. A25]|eukprot:GSA25T00009640001.1
MDDIVPPFLVPEGDDGPKDVWRALLGEPLLGALAKSKNRREHDQDEDGPRATDRRGSTSSSSSAGLSPGSSGPLRRRGFLANTSPDNTPPTRSET